MQKRRTSERPERDGRRRNPSASLAATGRVASHSRAKAATQMSFRSLASEGLGKSRASTI